MFEQYFALRTNAAEAKLPTNPIWQSKKLAIHDFENCHGKFKNQKQNP
jgi:hypothetical protein